MGMGWFRKHVETAAFYTNKSILSLIGKTENIYIKELERGDRQRAMKRLRVPPMVDTQSYWTAFKVS